MIKPYAYKISVSQEAVLLLEELFHLLSERVNLLINFRNTFVKVGCINFDRMLTARTCDGGVTFEPSDCLREFMFAAGARDSNGFSIKIDSHGGSFCG